MTSARTKATIDAHCDSKRVVHVTTMSPSNGGWFNLRDGETRVVELEPGATITMREIDAPKLPA